MTTNKITLKDEKGNTYRLELTKDEIKAEYKQPGKKAESVTVKLAKKDAG